MEYVSKLIAPLCIAVMGFGMLVSRKELFSEFTNGAKEGVKTSFALLPTLVALLCAISMFNASGASDYLTKLLAPIGEVIGIPSEIIPLIIIRPLSGGASTALMADIFNKYGADSFVGRCASVIAGSSDTLLYVVSVYFGAIGVKKTRQTVPVAFLSMFFCVFLALLLCRIFFK